MQLEATDAGAELAELHSAGGPQGEQSRGGNGAADCDSNIVVQHNIYLLGGEEVDPDSPTGSRTVNRVTRFDCERQRWSGGPSMLLARRWAGALTVDNTVYVIGGIGGKGGTYEKRLDSVESLELAEEGGGAGRRWRQLAPMSTPRSSHTCEVMGGLIYVVGGGDGKDWLCSAEVSSLHWLGLFKFNI